MFGMRNRGPKVAHFVLNVRFLGLMKHFFRVKTGFLSSAKRCLFFKRVLRVKKSLVRFFYVLFRQSQKQVVIGAICLILCTIVKVRKYGVFSFKNIPGSEFLKYEGS